MKLDKAPTESYADIGGLEQQIQEIKVRFSTPQPKQPNVSFS
jgi:ATP-dependent 26S proteasome regulatory subunit